MINKEHICGFRNIDSGRSIMTSAVSDTDTLTLILADINYMTLLKFLWHPKYVTNLISNVDENTKATSMLL